MLRGEKVLLRPLTRDDFIALYALHSDVVAWSAATPQPWTPRSLEIELVAYDKRIAEQTDDASATDFAIQAIDGGQLLGVGNLWGIDAHNRLAHVGIALLPDARGKSYATDVLRVLCDYAFRIRGLNRLGLETLVNNAPMIAAARKAGFVEEGVLRDHAWLAGEFVDEAF